MTLFDTGRAIAANAKVMHRIKHGAPLPPWSAFAALSVVLGNVPLQDAANSVGLKPADLVREVEAWAVAQGLGNAEQ